MEGNYRVANIFYTSNRNIKGTKDSSIIFGHDHTRDMTYGTMKVKVSPAIKIGRMLPERLQKDGIIVISEVKKTGEDVFLEQVAEAVKASPHNSLMVYISGDYDDFEAASIKTTYFMYLLDINTPIILFDWPGNQAVSISGYKKAQRYAMSSGPQLEALLVKVIKQVKPQKLWLNASSIGCQIVCEAVDQMHGCDDISDTNFKIDHIVFSAADIGKKEFSERYKKKLVSKSRNVTTYVSSNDNALLISQLINRRQRFGRQKIRGAKQCGEARGAPPLRSPDSSKLTLVDVTPVNNASYHHGYYLESSEFYDDFYQRVLGEDQEVSKRLSFLKDEDGIEYWVLRGDRKRGKLCTTWDCAGSGQCDKKSTR